VTVSTGAGVGSAEGGRDAVGVGQVGKVPLPAHILRRRGRRGNGRTGGKEDALSILFSIIFTII